MDKTLPIAIRMIPEHQLDSILSLVKLLNSNLEYEVLQQRLREMIEQGYQCAGMYCEDQLIAICGLWITTRFYCGKQLEPDNVIVHPDYRSHGLGQQLMEWVYEYARSQQCEVCELNAYVTNSPAHRFYLQQGFKILGFHFQKQLME